MAYLRIVQNRIQSIATTIASALNVEVVIADRDLSIVARTGDFYSVDENCPADSLFALIIEHGEPIINLTKMENCGDCSSIHICPEFTNMSYPIKNKDEIIGVISFTSFDKNQANIIRIKKDEYYNMLKQTAEIIEKYINEALISNELKNSITEVNSIINCINKGIIIINFDNKITHINNMALEILDISFFEYNILGGNINNYINGIRLDELGTHEIIDFWEINRERVRVRYNVNKLDLKDGEFSKMISFDEVQNFIHTAKTYENKKEILFDNIIGNSKEILNAINRAKIAATTDSTILIQGDSGTGKELFARSIHNESSRKAHRFIAINCTSIPDSLIESELFGYEKGTFTGANPDGKKGIIELANNGTLFLDEIGDLPLHLQAKFLRVLQERNINRVGGTKPIDVNIRVIAATNKDLIQLVKSGEFRLDLYYRLNVIPIDLPNLKNRGNDVLLCAEYIINKLCTTLNKEIKLLSDKVINKFKTYEWTGNIRELENVLEHGICFTKDKYIKIEDLPEYFFQDSFKRSPDPHFDLNKNLEELKMEYEKEVINNLIEIHGDTVEGKKFVAEKLDIGLTTLYRKMNGYKN